MNYLEPITASALAEASRPRSPLEQIIAEAARPRSPLEQAMADLAKAPSRLVQLDAMAREIAESKRQEEAFAALVQTIPVRQALEAEIALPTLAD